MRRQLTSGCWTVVVGLALMMDGCDGGQIRQSARMEHFEVQDGDFRLIAKASLDLIDPKGSITTVVVSPQLDRRARTALKAVANVVVNDDQVASDGTLPARYFRVRTFTIDDGVAFIEGQLGPVTNTITPAGQRDCGRIYTIPIELIGGDWVSRSYKVETCAGGRDWVAVDSDTPSD